MSERYRAYQDALRLADEEPQPAFLIGADNEMSSYEAYLSHDDREIESLTLQCQLAKNEVN